MVKEFLYKGNTIEQLQAKTEEELMNLFPSRERRHMKRGWTEEEKKLLKKLRSSGEDAVVRTHCRSMIVLPEMAGRKIAVYNGKEFTYLTIVPEMVGHRLGEFALTRKNVKHSAAGIGATRSTKFISVK
ncbi:MAG: 30S ribosomal protein S19 [Candidatus Diapherotrites archaeon]|nr:30S ribosomal protein S19 [Candidatus Diapherotrites archaeon]